MPSEPMSVFGWLMRACVSEERRKTMGESASEAVVFASGVAASFFTMYFAGLLHIL